MNFRMPLQFRAGFRDVGVDPAGITLVGSLSSGVVAGYGGWSASGVLVGISATGFLMEIRNFMRSFSACECPVDPPACCLLKVSRSTISSSNVISPRSWACTSSRICSPKVGIVTNSLAFASSNTNDRSTANRWCSSRGLALTPKLKNLALFAGHSNCWMNGLKGTLQNQKLWGQFTLTPKLSAATHEISDERPCYRQCKHRRTRYRQDHLGEKKCCQAIC